jgi:hypothetical protein
MGKEGLAAIQKVDQQLPRAHAVLVHLVVRDVLGDTFEDLGDLPFGIVEAVRDELAGVHESASISCRHKEKVRKLSKTGNTPLALPRHLPNNWG